MLEVKKLARIMHEEFERDGWGDIDPFLFKLVVDCEDDEDDDVMGLRSVLERVVKRLEEE